MDSGAANGGTSSNPPSCAPGAGMTTCPAGNGNESCCTSLQVPGGVFYRTYADNDAGQIDEADPATVSGFRLDKYLVTVGRFRQYVRAWNGGWVPSSGSGKHAHLNGGQGLVNSANPSSYEPGWQTSDNSNVAPTGGNLGCSQDSAWTTSAGSQENLPINCVNWYEAYAFCIWDGGFLPSEAEWEYAAAGGSQQRRYPWGSASPGMSNQYAIYGCYYPNGAGTCSGVMNLAPVGTAPAGLGAWGQLDLAGELFEKNLDWSAAFTLCTDCAYTTPTSVRVSHGGSFHVAATDLLPTYRNAQVPTNRGHSTGVRCARTP